MNEIEKRIVKVKGAVWDDGEEGEGDRQEIARKGRGRGWLGRCKPRGGG